MLSFRRFAPLLWVVPAAIAPLQAQAQNTRDFEMLVTSTCPEPMRFALRYLDSSNIWRSKAWWSLDPDDRFYISSGGNRLTHKLGLKYLYVYAETVSGRGYFPRDDGNPIKISEYKYAMSKPVEGNVDGDVFEFSLHCNDR